MQILCVVSPKSLSFWGTSSPRSPTGAPSLDPAGGLPSSRPPVFFYVPPIILWDRRPWDPSMIDCCTVHCPTTTQEYTSHVCTCVKNKMASSTKLEVHSISQCRQSRNNAQKTRWSLAVWFLRYAVRPQTHADGNTLSLNSYRGRSNYYVK